MGIHTELVRFGVFARPPPFGLEVLDVDLRQSLLRAPRALREAGGHMPGHRQRDVMEPQLLSELRHLAMECREKVLGDQTCPYQALPGPTPHIPTLGFQTGHPLLRWWCGVGWSGEVLWNTERPTLEARTSKTSNGFMPMEP